MYTQVQGWVPLFDVTMFTATWRYGTAMLGNHHDAMLEMTCNNTSRKQMNDLRCWTAMYSVLNETMRAITCLAGDTGPRPKTIDRAKAQTKQRTKERFANERTENRENEQTNR